MSFLLVGESLLPSSLGVGSRGPRLVALVKEPVFVIFELLLTVEPTHVSRGTDSGGRPRVGYGATWPALAPSLGVCRDGSSRSPSTDGNRLEPQWVHEVHRVIPAVVLRVPSLPRIPPHSDGVSRDEPTRCGVVVAQAVVVEPYCYP